MKLSSGQIMKWVGIIVGVIPPVIMWINIQYNLELTETQLNRITEMLELWLRTITPIECGSVGLVGALGNLKITTKDSND